MWRDFTPLPNLKGEKALVSLVKRKKPASTHFETEQFFVPFDVGHMRLMGLIPWKSKDQWGSPADPSWSQRRGAVGRLVEPPKASPFGGTARVVWQWPWPRGALWGSGLNQNLPANPIRLWMVLTCFNSQSDSHCWSNITCFNSQSDSHCWSNIFKHHLWTFFCCQKWLTQEVHGTSGPPGFEVQEPVRDHRGDTLQTPREEPKSSQNDTKTKGNLTLCQNVFSWFDW